MKTIIGYMVVQSSDGDELAVKVVQLLRKGWQPFGSVCQNVMSSDIEIFAQAMVRYEETKAS